VSGAAADAASQLRDRLAGLRHVRSERQQALAEVTEEIARYEAALAIIEGDEPVPSARRGAPTARAAITAALATFDGPVSSEHLMDHPDLTHYSRHTMRTALSDLRRSGTIVGERGPKGFIWDPAASRQNADDRDSQSPR
jgi:hypothetical protein